MSSYLAKHVPWSPAEDMLLRQYWAEQLSSHQIAERMKGRGRSAVLGRVHRLGLEKRGTTVVAKPRPKFKYIDAALEEAGRREDRFKAAWELQQPNRSPIDIPKIAMSDARYQAIIAAAYERVAVHREVAR